MQDESEPDHAAYISGGVCSAALSFGRPRRACALKAVPRFCVLDRAGQWKLHAGSDGEVLPAWVHYWCAARETTAAAAFERLKQNTTSPLRSGHFVSSSASKTTRRRRSSWNTVFPRVGSECVWAAGRLRVVGRDGPGRSKGFAEKFHSVGVPEGEYFILSRNAWAGSAAHGTALWSGAGGPGARLFFIYFFSFPVGAPSTYIS